MPRRVIVAALPHLAAEHRLRVEGLAGLTEPFALVERHGGALRLAAVNAAAAHTGLCIGTSLADARAMVPALATRPAEPERFEAFVVALARWAGRFSPLVGRDRGRDGTAFEAALVIDATGCAPLWGGEAAMLDAVAAGLDGLGLTAQLTLADGRGPAWALAHHAEAPMTIAPPGEHRAMLAPLPVAALRLDAGTLDALAALGLRRIGDLATLPRAQIARRVGLGVVIRLDQALGQAPEPVAPARTPPHFAARLTLPEPIGLAADVMAGLARLVDRVCARLAAGHAGARAMRLTAERVDGAAVSAGIRLARPMRDAPRLVALFAPKIEAMDAGHGIDALRLVASETEPLAPVQAEALAAGADLRRHEDERLAELIARLGNRLGFAHLYRLAPAGSHSPEGEFRMAPVTEAPPPWDAALAVRGPVRPLTLIPPEPIAVIEEVAATIGMTGTNRPPPARFRWRRRVHRLAAADGPERIAPSWWRADPAWSEGVRDYWRATTEAGPRLWLFHTPAAARPGWWCHGVFA